MPIPNMSPANLAIIEKQDKQQSTNNTVQKTETKSDKKKIILALAGLATIGLATIGIYALTKNHKKATQAGQDLSRRGEDLLQGLTGKPNKGNEVIDEAAQQAKKAEYLARLKKQIADDLDNPKFGKSRENYAVTPTVINKNSVEEDLSAWIQKRKEAPLLASNGAYLNCPDNIGLEKIKPHNYGETSDIFIVTREYNHGYHTKGRVVVDDSLEIMSGGGEETNFVNLARKKQIDGASEEHFEDFELLQGHDPNGKAYIMFKFQPARQDCKARQCTTTIMLRSKTSEFNQDQLDLIDAYKRNPDLLGRKKGHPFGLAFLVPKETSKNEASELQFNKNMFLSLIHHFANLD